MKHVNMFCICIPWPIHSKINDSDWIIEDTVLFEDSEGLKVALLKTNIVRLAYKIIWFAHE